MKIRAAAWRVGYFPAGRTFKYNLQLTSKNEKVMKYAIEEIGDCVISGSGWNPATKEIIFLLQKDFSSREDWFNFMNNLSFNLNEVA